jgi:F-type H+-transporting ATPase subunit gamma
MTTGTLALRHQIESARDLQSVVQTMKALAASSIDQYESSVRALDDYVRTVSLGLSVSLRTKAERARPAAGAEIGDRPLVAVVFGSDQGLAGQFNERIAAFAHARLAAHDGALSLWAVGERVEGRLQDLGLPVAGRFDVPVGVQAVVPLVGRILLTNEARLAGGSEQTELSLFHNRPAAGSVFEPIHQRILPIDREWLDSLIAAPWPTNQQPGTIGEPADTLRALLHEYLFVWLFRACAESLASENASRLAAMQRADRNIDELLERLETSFHRERQSSIDAELFDLIASFEALG